MYYGWKQNFTYKTLFIKTIILLTAVNWVFGPIPNRAERNPAGSVEEVVSRIDNDYDKDTGKPFWKNVKLVISKLIYQVYHQLRSSVDKPGI